MLLITKVISATFCNYAQWNRDREPCLKYGMTWWRNRLHKYRRDLMKSITEVVLLKLEKLTLKGGMLSGELIPQERRMVSWMFWMLLLLRDFPYECLRELLTMRAICLDPSMSHILNTTDVPFTFSFSRLRGERVDQKWVLAWEVWGIACNLKSLGQCFLVLWLSLKISEDNWVINNSILDFIIEEIMW